MSKPGRTTTAAANPDDTVRIQIRCAKQQDAIVRAAAAKAGADISTWCIAHLVSAAGKQETDDHVPVMVTGNLGERLRRAAKGQGVTPINLIKQWLIAAGG